MHGSKKEELTALSNCKLFDDIGYFVFFELIYCARDAISSALNATL